MKTDNKQIVRRIFDGLANGDPSAFRESLAEDFTWHLPGSTAWSRTYRGKKAVYEELFKPLYEQFDGPYKATLDRLTAEGDYVVAEYRGRVRTKAGKAYNNTYCWVCRLSDGKLSEVTEYMDTQLVVEVLDPPRRAGHA